MTSLQALAAGAGPPPTEEPPEPVPASAGPTADETTTLTRLDDEDPAARAEQGAGTDDVPEAPVPPPASAGPADAESPDPIDWWTVAPGDHLWHIAEETLIDQGAASPSSDEIATYWHTLCEVNHSRLVDPDNPDLIMPGQQIALPPVSAEG